MVDFYIDYGADIMIVSQYILMSSSIGMAVYAFYQKIKGNHEKEILSLIWSGALALIGGM